MSTMAGKWMLTIVAPDRDELIMGEYSWVDGDDGPEPEWVWFDDVTWPMEVLAERFIPEYREPMESVTRYRREERRRWFGLTEHEWETLVPLEPYGINDADLCVNCGVSRGDAQDDVPRPWDEHCRPETS